MDTSDTGVGAVLSQRSGTDQKFYLCTFFSRKLAPAERNYDVGDREPLAAKMVLEEWQTPGPRLEYGSTVQVIDS